MKLVFVTTTILFSALGVAKAESNPLIPDVIEWGASAAEISASTGGRLAGPLAKGMLDEVFRIDPPEQP